MVEKKMKIYYCIIFFFVCVLVFKRHRKKTILIALPTIDRDFCFVETFYKGLTESISGSGDGINFDILTIMRERDDKMYNFWKDKSIAKKIKNYEILEDRHNLEKVSETFNLIKTYAKKENYDNLIIIESDILLKKNTIQKLLLNLERSAVVLFPFETPWAKFPVVLNKEKKYVNSRDLHKDQYITGHGTGCVIMNKKVINDKKIRFNVDYYNFTKGQDVGFFKSLEENNYDVYLVNDELYHAYKYIEKENNKY